MQWIRCMRHICMIIGMRVCGQMQVYTHCGTRIRESAVTRIGIKSVNACIFECTNVSKYMVHTGCITMCVHAHESICTKTQTCKCT